MSETYPFQLVKRQSPTVSLHETKSLLARRPFIERLDRSQSTNRSGFDELKHQAKFYYPSDELLTAMNMAIAVGQPLLLTGEPGTGKTTAAYFAAHQLDLGILHFPVKSTSHARDLLYDFDAVAYFTDAQVFKTGALEERRTVSRNEYIRFQYLGEAIRSREVKILLIDEIDKASRDFPNDLLLEIEHLCFEVPEGDYGTQQAPLECRPIVIVTSNSERSLPDPFLRRCIVHHIEFRDDLLKKVVNRHFPPSPLGGDETGTDKMRSEEDELRSKATQSFLQLRKERPQKPPSIGEFLTWLEILLLPDNREVWQQIRPEKPGSLPFLGALLKHPLDLNTLRKRS